MDICDNITLYLIYIDIWTYMSYITLVYGQITVISTREQNWKSSIRKLLCFPADTRICFVAGHGGANCFIISLIVRDFIEIKGSYCYWLFATDEYKFALWGHSPRTTWTHLDTAGRSRTPTSRLDSQPVAPAWRQQRKQYGGDLQWLWWGLWRDRREVKWQNRWRWRWPSALAKYGV